MPFGKGLWQRRGRAWLTVCSIAVGTVMLFAMTVIGDTGADLLESEMDAMGLNGLSVSATQEDDVPLTEDHLAALRAIPTVSEAMPLMLKSGRAEAHESTVSAVFCGVGEGAHQTIALACRYGRLLQSGDISDGAAVCVADEALAKKLYGRENIVGKRLRVAVGNTSAEFTVVGVSATDSTLLTNLTGYLPAMIFVPYTTLQTMTGDPSFFRIAVRCDGATDASQGRILQALDRVSGTKDGFRSENLAGQKQKLMGMIDAADLVFTLIGAVALVVGGMGMMTAMLSAIHERKKEIGIKMAIGATRGHILREFLSETVSLAAIGGLMGVLIGVAAGSLAVWWWEISVAFSFERIVEVLLFTVAVGGAFGIYPAWKAASLTPVEALRQG